MPDHFIGLMSGTSVDAVDGALVDLSGAAAHTTAFASEPIPESLRTELLALQRPGPDELGRAALAAIALTRIYASVARRLLPDGAPTVRAIGAHGQTVRHRPELGYTLQILDGALLAELAGVDVVCDLRSADVAAGGQGAPLVPGFHAGVFADASRRRAVVNIGGVANLTLLAPGEPVLGFDSGPGNVLLDGWCEAHTGERFDRDGRWAATGTADPRLLASLLSEPYFGMPAPKSTGRDRFHLDWLRRVLPPRIDARDVQATLLELTARTIADAATRFDAEEVFVCGGGARNGALMRRLAALLSPARLSTTAELGIDPQAVEATAFAWLAAQRVAEKPGNVPAVTGARGPRVLGALYRAPAA